MNVIFTPLERILCHATGCLNNFEFRRQNDANLSSYLTKGSDIS